MALIAERHGARALVTRPHEEAEGLAAALMERGVDALIEPMMEVHFRADAAPDLRGVQAVLCTSANGVRALARTTDERGVALFAVGDATAARARGEGFLDVVSAHGTAADLARCATERLRSQDGRLLHVAGSVASDDLVAQLGAQGFAIERCVLYEARPVAALSPAARGAISAGEIDFALFYSPRTAAIFVHLAGAAGVTTACERVTALSISTAADTQLATFAWRARLVAHRPDQPAMLTLIDRLLAPGR